jgi:hypothetical protein
MQLVTQVLGRLMDQCLTVYMLIKGLLSLLVSKLLVSITLVSQSVANLQLLNHLVKIKQSINHLVASLIIQGLLTKVEITIALLNLGAHGQQLLTTVRQIPQRVLNLLKRGN